MKMAIYLAYTEINQIENIMRNALHYRIALSLFTNLILYRKMCFSSIKQITDFAKMLFDKFAKICRVLG